ncbi:hypothetical protein BaRGS_00008737 [Batillaria attramentaria]|uniref:Secreted protein n=1 Tax=Batillaria attramentaria TaxID=370345 RepID=A0ABD0LLI9_9CAEN
MCILQLGIVGGVGFSGSTVVCKPEGFVSLTGPPIALVLRGAPSSRGQVFAVAGGWGRPFCFAWPSHGTPVGRRERALVARRRCLFLNKTLPLKPSARIVRVLTFPNFLDKDQDCSFLHRCGRLL